MIEQETCAPCFFECQHCMQIVNAEGHGMTNNNLTGYHSNLAPPGLQRPSMKGRSFLSSSVGRPARRTL